MGLNSNKVDGATITRLGLRKTSNEMATMEMTPPPFYYVLFLGVEAMLFAHNFCTAENNGLVKNSVWLVSLPPPPFTYSISKKLKIKKIFCIYYFIII